MIDIDDILRELKETRNNILILLKGDLKKLHSAKRKDELSKHLLRINKDIMIVLSSDGRGADGDKSLTLENIGDVFGISRERVRQIEAAAMKQLRHPNTGMRLREYLDLSFFSGR